MGTSWSPHTSFALTAIACAALFLALVVYGCGGKSSLSDVSRGNPGMGGQDGGAIIIIITGTGGGPGAVDARPGDNMDARPGDNMDARPGNKMDADMTHANDGGPRPPDGGDGAPPPPHQNDAAPPPPRADGGH
jgi:hypothetical protein